MYDEILDETTTKNDISEIWKTITNNKKCIKTTYFLIIITFIITIIILIFGIFLMTYFIHSPDLNLIKLPPGFNISIVTSFQGSSQLAYSPDAKG
jgi:ABC-type antimicrobial peptide transport system permease subunit